MGGGPSGSKTFQDLFHQNKTAIAELPKSRLDWWVQNKFLVLKTDQRFKDLTDEDIFLMREHHFLDNPDLKKQMEEVHSDPEYDKAEENLDVDQRAMDAREEPDLNPID